MTAATTAAIRLTLPKQLLRRIDHAARSTAWSRAELLEFMLEGLFPPPKRKKVPHG